MDRWKLAVLELTTRIVNSIEAISYWEMDIAIATNRVLLPSPSAMGAHKLVRFR